MFLKEVSLCNEHNACNIPLKMNWDILGIYDWDLFGMYMGYIRDIAGGPVA